MPEFGKNSTNIKPKDDMLNTSLAAEYLGVSKRTLERDRAKINPEIPYSRLGRSYIYSKTRIMAWWKKKIEEREEVGL